MTNTTTSTSSSISRNSITSVTTPSPTIPSHDTFNKLIEQSIAKTYRSFEKRYRNCPSLRNALKNGYVKLRSYPNRVARFTCNRGFDLIGNRYSTCSRNRWTHDLPVCVSTYCPVKLNVQPPLMVRKISNHSSVVDLTCELGFRLQVAKKNSGKYYFDSDRNSYQAASIRAYCVSKQWLIDDLDQPDHSYTSAMIPLDQWPTCESKHPIMMIRMKINPSFKVYEKAIDKSMNCTFESTYGTICGWMQ
ncbi:hypothetical protein BLA29_003160, partial [Euroglyphus maynei]